LQWAWIGDNGSTPPGGDNKYVYASIMPTIAECVCCMEIDRITLKVSDVDDPTVMCTTQHPGLDDMCLNAWVLQAAYYQHRQEHETASSPTRK